MRIPRSQPNGGENYAMGALSTHGGQGPASGTHLHPHGIHSRQASTHNNHSTYSSAKRTSETTVRLNGSAISTKLGNSVAQ